MIRVMMVRSSSAGSAFGVCAAAPAPGTARAALERTASPKEPLKKALREEDTLSFSDRSDMTAISTAGVCGVERPFAKCAIVRCFLTENQEWAGQCRRVLRRARRAKIAASASRKGLRRHRKVDWISPALHLMNSRNLALRRPKATVPAGPGACRLRRPACRAASAACAEIAPQSRCGALARRARLEYSANRPSPP
jgi:hypothetical protein